MPIQFRCKKCQSWIEVDGEHAGGKAICPFCQAVNDVPKESERPVAARPADQGPYTGVPTEPTRPGVPEVPLSKPPKSSGPGRFESEQGRFDAGRAGLPTPLAATNRLNRIGIIGFVMAILSIACMATPTIIALYHLPEPLKQKLWRETPADAQAARQLQTEAMEHAKTYLEAHPWLGALGSAGLLLWLVSMVLSIRVIFSAGMHRRTYAWAGLAVNTILLFGCLCSGMLQRLVGS